MEVLLFLQGCTIKPKMHCSWVQVKIHALLLSAAEQNQADNSLVPLHLDPWSFCSSYKGALTSLRCTAAGLRSKSMHCCSVSLSKTKLTTVFSHCSHTREGFALLEGCTQKPKMHCSRVQVKIHALLLSAAEQNQADSSLLPLHLQP